MVYVIYFQTPKLIIPNSEQAIEQGRGLTAVISVAKQPKGTKAKIGTVMISDSCIWKVVYIIWLDNPDYNPRLSQLNRA